MAVSAKPLRRVVTAVDVDGRSYVRSDGASSHVIEIAGVERATQLWRTEAAIREVPFTEGTEEMENGFLSPAGPHRAMFALIEFAPGDIADRVEVLAEMGEHFRTAMDGVKDKRHPAMHVTDTIEYAVMLEGEVTLILDKDETVLRAGDVLIQGGVSHSWVNHTDKPAKLLGVQLGAVRRQS